MASEISGIAQTDVILRTAVIEALQRMRDNPTFLDEVFASLKDDQLTKDVYGQSEISEARAWFLKTDVPVFMSFRPDESKLPCISISLQESTETEQTLGDVHYIPIEATEADWPVLAGPFNPLSYAPSSGMLVIPPDAIKELILYVGMKVKDRAGRIFDVQEILDDNIVGLLPGSLGDFTNAILLGGVPKQTTTIESTNFRETYSIGVHAQGSPIFLTRLHAIVLYALLKFKEELLEARGIERTTLSSSDFRRNQELENELAFSRWITMNGFVRNVWSKKVRDRLGAVYGDLRADSSPTGIVTTEDEGSVSLFSDDTIP